MEFADQCRKRQAELQRILNAMDLDQVWAGDQLAAEHFRRNARKTISLYEKIIHLANGDRVGHA
jgi:hypothetical protein